MEGTLQPGVHYVEIRDDYADLEEKVAYFTKNTDQARRIVTHANHYVAQFQDADLEALIAMKVVEKYFALSGQPSSGQARAGAATSIL